MADRSVANVTTEKWVDAWFQRTGGGSLVLPDGWFGRPFDNLHQLTFSCARPNAILIELDDQLHLLLNGSVQIVEEDAALVLKGFTSCVFVWLEYGGGQTHRQVYDTGEVRFQAPPGA